VDPITANSVSETLATPLNSTKTNSRGSSTTALLAVS
jgi:hypothetical protein